LFSNFVYKILIDKPDMLIIYNMENEVGFKMTSFLTWLCQKDKRVALLLGERN
jgi:hypothetical protein